MSLGITMFSAVLARRTTTPARAFPLQSYTVMSSWKRSKVFASLVALATVVTSSLSVSRASAETLTMAQAITLGLSKSPAVHAAKARTEAADATSTTIARSGYLPSASIEGGFLLQGTGFHGSVPTNQPPPLPAEIGRKEAVYGYGGVLRANFNWTLYDFGKTSSNVGAANANYESTFASQKESTNSAAAGIAQAYLTLFYQERFLEVASATLQTRDKLNAITKGLVKSGILPPMEELRAASRLDAARRDMERAKTAAEDARINLAVNLGMEPGAPIKTATPKLPQVDLETAAAVREGETKRPALLAAERAADSRRAEKDAASSGFLPTIAIVAAANNSFLNNDNRDFRQDTLFGQASLVLRQPLDLSLFSRVDQANANLAAAEADLEATRRDVRSDAARAAVAVKSTSVQVQHAKKAEEGSQAVRAIVEARYIRGLSSPLELVDAEDSDIATRITRIQAEFDYALAIVRLQVATGRPIAEEGSQ